MGAVKKFKLGAISIIFIFCAPMFFISLTDIITGNIPKTMSLEKEVIYLIISLAGIAFGIFVVWALKKNKM